MNRLLSRAILTFISCVLLIATPCSADGLPLGEPDLPFLLVSDCDKNQTDVVFAAVLEAKYIYGNASQKLGNLKNTRAQHNTAATTQLPPANHEENQEGEQQQKPSRKPLGPQQNVYDPKAESPENFDDQTLDFVLDIVNTILNNMTGPAVIEITCGYSWLQRPIGQVEYRPKPGTFEVPEGGAPVGSFLSNWWYDNRTSVDPKIPINERWFECVYCYQIDQNLDHELPTERPKAVQFWKTMEPATTVLSLTADKFNTTWERPLESEELDVQVNSLKELNDTKVPKKDWDLYDIYSDSLAAYLVGIFFRTESLKGGPFNSTFDRHFEIHKDSFAWKYVDTYSVRRQSKERYNSPQIFVYLLLSIYLNNYDCYKHSSRDSIGDVREEMMQAVREWAAAVPEDEDLPPPPSRLPPTPPEPDIPEAEIVESGSKDGYTADDEIPEVEIVGGGSEDGYTADDEILDADFDSDGTTDVDETPQEPEPQSPYQPPPSRPPPSISPPDPQEPNQQPQQQPDQQPNQQPPSRPPLNRQPPYPPNPTNPDLDPVPPYQEHPRQYRAPLPYQQRPPPPPPPSRPPPGPPPGRPPPAPPTTSIPNANTNGNGKNQGGLLNQLACRLGLRACPP